MIGVLSVRLPSAMRLALGLSVLFTISALLAGTVAYAVMSDELRGRLLDDARVEAVALAAELRNSGLDEMARQIRTISAVGDGLASLYFFQPAGPEPAVGNMTPRALFEGPRSLSAGRDFTFLPDTGEQEGEIYFAYGLRAPGGWIVVARDSQWVTDSQEVLVQSIAWGLGVALLATVLLAMVIGRRGTRRVAKLNQVLAAVSAGDFTARYPEDERAGDDLGKVATGLNAMLERLEANVERLAQVSADIAHDLRSPLTRLRLRLEPHALRPDLPEDTREAIAMSLENLDSVSASFDAILQLSQMETGNMEIETAPVDLSGIARDVFEMMSPVAEEMGHRLDLIAPEGPLRAVASAELISQALVNLVDNAMRHAPAPATIRITVAQKDGGVSLAVADDGPGIPAEEREKVTRRFYRLDRSRNRPGTGLGLSLVSAIARLHAGRLDLADGEPGLCATIFIGSKNIDINQLYKA